MASTKKQKVVVSIFYHISKKPSERTYWIGTVAKDGSCEHVLKNISGKGAEALKRAKNYMEKL